MNNPYAWLKSSLNSIHKANWYRSCKTINSMPDSEIELMGKKVINFASNDYLGIAGDERLAQAAITAIKEFGTGSTGSRLLSGHRQLHGDLEKAIAQLKQTEDALVFSSGYLANLGTISALVGQKDLILADEYNHSSLKNGAKLSGATVLNYTHNHIEDLQAKLQQLRNQYRRCLIVTDSVFSMDGNICKLPELVELAKVFQCMLLVDEAHATGVMGKNGAGCVEYFGLTGEEIIQIGTLSKALGSLGGYVAGSEVLIDFLRNRASTWIYTTGLSPADTAAALEAIKIVKDEPQRREWLWDNVNLLKTSLKQELSGLNLLPTQSQIICLGLENPSSALSLADKLHKAGIFAPAIRPPTVPTSRIRFSVMATHKHSQIRFLLDILHQE